MQELRAKVLSDRLAEFDAEVKEKRKRATKPEPLTKFGFEVPEERLLSIDAAIREKPRPRRKEVTRERPANQITPENEELF